ncbi:Transcription factor IWS1 [Cytospora mali]|uniref:Transcription factor IWS1 n=1 Tax=Cytospora mali TaxID=578113 RepID=A0A194URE7_CYTMA|nr:Transcription factor IWS1 [Valsa mali var. pyri (nom. inval.)]
MSDIEDHQASPPPEDDVPAGSDAGNDDDDDAMSDRDSDILSEVDVDDLEDYDPLKANIEQRPVDIDEDVAKTLKATKRKRAEGETAKKAKEGRRQKKRRTDEGDEVSAADGTIIEGKRRRGGAGAGAGGEKQKKARSKRPTPEPENDDHLTPAQKRAKAIEKAIDASTKGKSKRRTKKDEVDLEEALDDHIAELKMKMESACEADNEAREQDRAAVNKVKLLPEVMTLLNRQNIQHAILDPETNFLQAVKFFLEPLIADGSLPAYNIQREIFTALTKMTIDKDTLYASGIGKVVLFYTKTKRAQPEIKRMAERLMGEWSRPILKRTDDYKKRQIEGRVVDPNALKYSRPSSQLPSSQASLAHRPGDKKFSSVSEKLAAKRAAMLEPVRASNRARPVGLPASYTVAPIAQLSQASGPDHRPVGESGMEAFRRMIQKKTSKKG